MLRWFHQWWIADRIRFTPGHCQLFQLAVGDRVLVRNRLWVVVERREAIAEVTIEVYFQLAEIDEENSKSVRLHIGWQDLNYEVPTVGWKGDCWEEELFEEDVVVLKDS